MILLDALPDGHFESRKYLFRKGAETVRANTIGLLREVYLTSEAWVSVGKSGDTKPVAPVLSTYLLMSLFSSSKWGTDRLFRTLLEKVHRERPFLSFLWGKLIKKRKQLDNIQWRVRRGPGLCLRLDGARTTLPLSQTAQCGGQGTQRAQRRREARSAQAVAGASQRDLPGRECSPSS